MRFIIDDSDDLGQALPGPPPPVGPCCLLTETGQEIWAEQGVQQCIEIVPCAAVCLNTEVGDEILVEQGIGPDTCIEVEHQ